MNVPVSDREQSDTSAPWLGYPRSGESKWLLRCRSHLTRLAFSVAQRSNVALPESWHLPR